jgi:multiple sugar transport system substrate-binding protein
MRGRSVILVALLVTAPLGARAADLVVWWEKGYYPQEDQAIAEIIAAFEQESSKRVEVVFQKTEDVADKILAALEADRPPDLAFALRLRHYFVQWALEDRLVDLTDTVGFFSDLFDPETLSRGRVRNPETGQTALYGLPIGRSTNYLHVWKSLMEQAGFTLEDIPKEWDPFWSFWCDQVQPAVRRAWGGTTFGGSASTCRARRPRPICNSSNSWMRTTQIT